MGLSHMVPGIYPLHLLSTVDQPLLDRWDAFLFLHMLFYLLNGVGGFDVQLDLFAGECANSENWVSFSAWY